MTENCVSYAQALYSLAKEEALTQQLLQQLQVLQTAFAEEPKFLQLLAQPGVSKQERCEILDDCLRDKTHPYILNFLKILTEEGIVRYFADCVKVYEAQYNSDHNIVIVTAVTAVALNAEQAARLHHKLEQITGKTVVLKNQIDPACLGGVRLDFDGKRVDGTVKSRLEALRSQLNNTVL